MRCALPVPVKRHRVPVKRHRGEPGHTRDTRDTRTHKGTRTTQTNLATIQTHQQHAPRTSARRPKPRPTQQPQARSRPCVTGTGRETIATSYPDSSNVGTCRNRPKLRGSERNVKVPCDHKGRYPSWNLKEPDMGIQSEPIGVSPVWSMGIFPPFGGTEGSRGKPDLGNLWGNGMRTAKLRNARTKIEVYATEVFRRFQAFHGYETVSCLMQSESRLSVVT